MKAIEPLYDTQGNTEDMRNIAILAIYELTYKRHRTEQKQI